jgi:hypothetical protein
MPSQKANKYGTAAEKWLADDRGLTLEREYWMDARRGNGDFVEIKACDVNSTGYFQIFEKAHSQLRRNARANDVTAWYGFVPYRKAGSGMRVVDSKMVRVGDMPRMSWTGTGGHRGSRRARVNMEEVL